MDHLSSHDPSGPITTAEDEKFRRYMDQALDRAKAEAKRRKRPIRRSGQYGNTDPQIAFLRRRISRLNYGARTDVGVRPELAKEKMIRWYNERRFGAALKNEQFTQHFAGDQTYYFWADPAAAGDEIIIMVDIDSHHGVGTAEGARRFADLIRDRVLPGMYSAPSTNGIGVHGYVVVRKKLCQNLRS